MPSRIIALVQNANVVQSQEVPHPHCCTLSRHPAWCAKSTFQNTCTCCRLVIVIASEMKYVPSQIITPTLCVPVLCPAAFSEAVKKEVTSAKAESTQYTIPWSSHTGQMVGAGVPHAAPLLPSPATLGCLVYFTPQGSRERESPTQLRTQSGYGCSNWKALPNWCHSLLPWICHYHRLGAN